MHMGLGLLTLWVTAYILGTIPTALIITYLLTGKDLRCFGDGSLKFTNLWRILGPEVTGFMFLAEMVKGMFVVNIIKLTALNASWAESLIFFGTLGLLIPFRKDYGRVSPVPFMLGALYWLRPEIAQVALALGIALLLIYRKAHLTNKAVALTIIAGYSLLPGHSYSLLWGVSTGLLVYFNEHRQQRQIPQEI